MIMKLRRRHRGFTLSETLVVAYLISVLSSIALSELSKVMDKARLMRCQTELRGIQLTVMTAWDESRSFPEPETLWSAMWNNDRPAHYYYVVDGETNIDGIDESAGSFSSVRDPADIDFVIFCDHDHKHLAEYVYVVDESEPKLATEDNDPGYRQFMDGGS
jgi:prepilin-type N-terminal cleavage/methylation domain-containing protein